MTAPVIAFSGSPIDRADAVRADPERLSALTFERWGAGTGKVILGNSGFEAVEAALKTSLTEFQVIVANKDKQEARCAACVDAYARTRVLTRASPPAAACARGRCR